HLYRGLSTCLLISLSPTPPPPSHARSALPPCLQDSSPHSASECRLFGLLEQRRWCAQSRYARPTRCSGLEGIARWIYALRVGPDCSGVRFLELRFFGHEPLRQPCR
ncbi:hypothetical protein FA95DRAFT_1674071, partial [Auriscalpium vulgare]